MRTVSTVLQSCLKHNHTAVVAQGSGCFWLWSAPLLEAFVASASFVSIFCQHLLSASAASMVSQHLHDFEAACLCKLMAKHITQLPPCYANKGLFTGGYMAEAQESVLPACPAEACGDPLGHSVPAAQARRASAFLVTLVASQQWTLLDQGKASLMPCPSQDHLLAQPAQSQDNAPLSPLLARRLVCGM